MANPKQFKSGIETESISREGGGANNEVFFTDGTVGVPSGGGGGDLNINRVININEADLATVDKQGIVDYLMALDPPIDNSDGKNLYIKVGNFVITTDQLIFNIDVLDPASFAPNTDDTVVTDTVTSTVWDVNQASTNGASVLVYYPAYHKADKSWKFRRDYGQIYGTGVLNFTDSSPVSIGMLIRFFDFNSNNAELFEVNTGGALKFGLDGTTGFPLVTEDATPVYNPSSGYSYPLQEWLYIVMVQDTVAGETRVYVNGVERFSWNSVKDLNGTSIDQWMHGQASDNVNADVKLIHAYKKTLTPTEVNDNLTAIQSRYDLSLKTPFISNIMIWYKAEQDLFTTYDTDVANAVSVLYEASERSLALSPFGASDTITFNTDRIELTGQAPLIHDGWDIDVNMKIADDFHGFFIFKNTVEETGKDMFNVTYDANNRFAISVHSGFLRVGTYNGSAFNSKSIAFNDLTSFHKLEFQYSSGVLTCYLDDVEMTLTSNNPYSTTNRRLCIGGVAGGTTVSKSMEFKELIVTEGIMSAGDRTTVLNSISTKHGL